MTTRNMFGLLLLAIAPVALAQANANAQRPPRLLDCSRPWYPLVARAAQVHGSVKVLLTVQSGSVINARILDDRESPSLSRAKGVIDDTVTVTTSNYSVLAKQVGLLADATLANVRTWRFADTVNQHLPVTYTYSMNGRPAGQSKEKVHFSRTLDFTVTVRPPVLDE
jgi:hypothetical protein